MWQMTHEVLSYQVWLLDMSTGDNYYCSVVLSSDNGKKMHFVIKALVHTLGFILGCWGKLDLTPVEL